MRTAGARTATGGGSVFPSGGLRVGRFSSGPHDNARLQPCSNRYAYRRCSADRDATR